MHPIHNCFNFVSPLSHLFISSFSPFSFFIIFFMFILSSKIYCITHNNILSSSTFSEITLLKLRNQLIRIYSKFARKLESTPPYLILRLCSHSVTFVSNTSKHIARHARVYSGLYQEKSQK